MLYLILIVTCIISVYAVIIPFIRKNFISFSDASLDILERRKYKLLEELDSDLESGTLTENLFKELRDEVIENISKEKEVILGSKEHLNEIENKIKIRKKL